MTWGLVGIALIALYLLCGFAAYGLTLGSFSQEFPYMKCTGFSVCNRCYLEQLIHDLEGSDSVKGEGETA